MRRLTCVFAAAIALAPSAAEAGGVWVPVRGVRALSMGGAYVAGAEEAHALWYNPANLDQTSVLLDVGGVFLSADYTSLDGRTVSNQGRALPNPTIGGVFRLHDRVSIAAGAYAPYSPQHRFDEDGPQRYNLVESDRTTKLFVHLAAAVRLGPVRIGGGIQNVDFQLRQRSMLSGYTGLFGEPTDRELDVLSELEMHDPFTLTGNFGAAVDLGPVTLGATVQLPYTPQGQATFRVRLGESIFFDPIEVEGDQVQFAVPFPWMVRAGILWRALDDLKVEAAFNWEGWSVQDQLVIDPQGGITLRDVPSIGDYEVGPLIVDRGMRDTWSVHLGGDYRLLESLSARAGLFYEISAFPDETFSAAQLDGEKLGFGAGASYRWRWLRVDASVGYVHQMTREISGSRLRQVNTTNPEQAAPVGDGTYRSALWIAGLGFAWLYDG